VRCGRDITRVTFTLYRLPGDDTPLRTIVSHPAALTQCSRFIRQGGLATEAGSSTAAACATVAQRGQPGSAALAAPGAGELYGLVAAATEMEDTRGAMTRFVKVGREAPPQTGRDRTAFIIQPPQDQPGGWCSSAELLARAEATHRHHLAAARDALGNMFTWSCEATRRRRPAAIHDEPDTAGETIRSSSFPRTRRPTARSRDYDGLRAYRACWAWRPFRGAAEPGA